MALKLITAPAEEPITLAEAKAHLRYGDDDQDALITMLIQATRTHIDGKDGFLGRALVTQTWELVIDKFSTAEIKVPLPPLQEIVSIKYDDAAGVEQTIDPSGYSVDNVSEPGWVLPVTAGWPTPIDAVNAVRVRFVAGYAPSADSPENLTANVPASIKVAMLLTIGSLFEHRATIVVGQTVFQLPWGAEQLLRPFRVQLGMA